MGWIILIVVGIILFKFLTDLNKERNKLDAQGGMKEKYSYLIDEILSGHPNCRILDEKKQTIIIGVSSMGGTTTFTLMQTFGSLSVTYEVNSPVYGKFKENWTFDENMSQERMFDKMIYEIAKINNRVSQ